LEHICYQLPSKHNIDATLRVRRNTSVGGEVEGMKVVFVHGALVFDGAWWWHRMVEPLATLGLGSRAVELPSCVAPSGASRGTVGDMYADADAVRAALDEEDGPVVLVGHSYGGMLITDAAAGHGNVEHLVYVTSVMPERDETLAGLGGGREPGPWMDPRPEDGTMGVKAELLAEAFMQDCDEAAVAGALERLTRQPLAVFGQAPRAVAWREKPSTYVVCAEDRATPPEAQRGYARRAGKVVELPTGHHPMLSHPELLARVIAEAAAPGG
jgi:pimeloyl-ACP methyl ester carboxylesterase